MNKTNIISREFQVFKNGFSVYGRSINGECILKHKTFFSTSVNSTVDSTFNSSFNSTFNSAVKSLDDSPVNSTANSNFDYPLKFGQDTLYTCISNMTFSEFYDYCYFNKWENFLIFNIKNDIKFLGKYGSSDIESKSVNNIFIEKIILYYKGLANSYKPN